MNRQAFDGLTRRATAALSRRASLAALGRTALLAGLVGPTAEVLALKGKKKKKNKTRQTCQE